MKKLTKLLAAALILGASSIVPNACDAARQKLNYYYESASLLDIKDAIGDDKGTGYYQYPQDRRLKRGTFDIKNFRVFEEGDVIGFEITMRNYIMRNWEDTGKSDYQGFVANLWDIYIDIDGIPNSGYEDALPGRDVLFADKMGWEKVVMICPKDPAEIEEILRESTDNLDFQGRVDDIIIPDYVEIQGNKIIVKISKKKLPRITEKSGFQCFSLGYSNVVSSNRLLNRDVKTFTTFDDFGGGSNEYGDPTIIDMIVPEGANQYELLRNHTTAAFRDNIRYAEVPFVYANGNRISPAVQALNRTPLSNQCPQTVIVQPVAVQQNAPVMQPVNQQPVMQPVMQPVNQRPVAQPAYQGQQAQPIRQTAPQQTAPANNGFVPLKKTTTQTNPSYNNVPNGFVPVKKNQ